MYYLYSITNTIDNTKYIGITNDTKRRFREHKTGSSNRYLAIAQEAFGIEAFVYKVECIGTRDYIDSLEPKLILSLKNSGQTLYNVAKGGLIGNGAPGEEHWNHVVSQEDVVHIRLAYASNNITQRDLALKYCIGYKAISKIVRGERWTEAGGPITLEKQSISKVANRRKLTDPEIIELRNIAKEEYELNGHVDIKDMADFAGIARGNMRHILKGEVYKNLTGPLLGVNYYLDFGRGK